jgi:hypothetical protein
MTRSSTEPSHRKSLQLTFSGYARNKVSGAIRFFNIAKDSSTTSFNTYWQIGGCELPVPHFRCHSGRKLIYLACQLAAVPFVNGVQANSQRVNHILDSGTTLILVSFSLFSRT